MNNLILSIFENLNFDLSNTIDTQEAKEEKKMRGVFFHMKTARD